MNNAYLFHQWEKGLFDASRLYLDIVQLVQSQRIGHDGSFRRNFDKNISKGLLLSTHSESETWVSKGVERNTRGGCIESIEIITYYLLDEPISLDIFETYINFTFLQRLIELEHFTNCHSYLHRQ